MQYKCIMNWIIYQGPIKPITAINQEMFFDFDLILYSWHCNNPIMGDLCSGQALCGCSSPQQVSPGYLPSAGG